MLSHHHQQCIEPTMRKLAIWQCKCSAAPSHSALFHLYKYDSIVAPTLPCKHSANAIQCRCFAHTGSAKNTPGASPSTSSTSTTNNRLARIVSTVSQTRHLSLGISSNTSRAPRTPAARLLSGISCSSGSCCCSAARDACQPLCWPMTRFYKDDSLVVSKALCTGKHWGQGNSPTAACGGDLESSCTSWWQRAARSKPADNRCCILAQSTLYRSHLPAVTPLSLGHTGELDKAT